ncbi:hypothetical protein AGMMS50212_01140 [Spirochaetia bacterium]|nr:hypothetical protein AGMMS50212_01140 [Spirochaetia bacterium]
MKKVKIKYFFAILLSFILCCLFSCDNVNNAIPRSTNENHSTYTVLYYNATANPGDYILMLPYLLQVRDVGASDTVSFAAQTNFQIDLKAGSAWSASERVTQRFWLKKGKSDDFEFDNPDSLLKLAEPNTIANFIRWGTEKFPADKYILVMMGHGAVWNPAYDKNDGWVAPSNEPVSYMLQPDSSMSGGILEPDRASLFDDSFAGEPAVSSFALAEGIKRAGKKIDLVYHHACLQNMLENLCELKDTGLVDYTLAAGHNTSSVGGDYGSLLKILNTGADIESVISEYCYYNVKHMDVELKQSELIFTDLRKLDPVLASIKNIVELFKNHPGIGNLTSLPVKINESTSGVYFYDAMVNPLTGIPEVNPANWKSADLNSYIQYMGMLLTQSTVIPTHATDLLKAINEAIVWGEDTSSIPIYTTFGVTVMPNTMYTTTPGGYSTYYPQTAFDKATGWSTWLSSAKNVAVHVLNPTWAFSGQVMYSDANKKLIVVDSNITANSKVDPTKLRIGGTDLVDGVNYEAAKTNVVNGYVEIYLDTVGLLSPIAASITVGSTTIDIGAGFVTTNSKPNAPTTNLTITNYP